MKKLTKKPVNGMKDILPAEMEMRDYLINLIKETYKSFGYTPIETPCIEHIENLSSKQGGENEKLIFKILKRGEKLNLETAKEENDVVDSALRYDLTVPLVRFYSNNSASLPSPFKALQIGSVWRADRPQRGRFRQFVQCDIDVLGDATNLAEIELILATTTLLGKIGFEDFAVHINDRRILKEMASYCDFKEEDFDNIFIILDKMDKIAIEGVVAELLSEGYAPESVKKYQSLLTKLDKSADFATSMEVLKGVVSEEVLANLATIVQSVEGVNTAKYQLKFDTTLVRGMSYYTGTIFEIKMNGFNGSVAGGGRYDDMIAKFTGNATPACGFSIGFERIVTILLESGYQIPTKAKKVAYLIEKGMDTVRLCEIINQAQKQRVEGMNVLVAFMNKNRKFQKEQLISQGYEDIVDFFKDALK